MKSNPSSPSQKNTKPSIEKNSNLFKSRLTKNMRRKKINCWNKSWHILAGSRILSMARLKNSVSSMRIVISCCCLTSSSTTWNRFRIFTCCVYSKISTCTLSVIWTKHIYLCYKMYNIHYSNKCKSTLHLLMNNLLGYKIVEYISTTHQHFTSCICIYNLCSWIRRHPMRKGVICCQL